MFVLVAVERDIMQINVGIDVRAHVVLENAVLKNIIPDAAEAAEVSKIKEIPSDNNMENQTMVPIKVRVYLNSLPVTVKKIQDSLVHKEQWK